MMGLVKQSTFHVEGHGRTLVWCVLQQPNKLVGMNSDLIRLTRKRVTYPSYPTQYVGCTHIRLEMNLINGRMTNGGI